MKIDGQTALVTGGGSGLGLGVARHCLAEGARVAIFEVSESKVRQLQEAFGPDVLVMQGDVTRAADLQACRCGRPRWSGWTACSTRSST